MTAALTTATNEDARRAVNTTSAPTTTQTQHDQCTTDETMITTPLLLLPAVCLTEPGPRPERRSPMRVVYDRRRELRQQIAAQGSMTCTRCDGHGWGHPADDGEAWPCFWCVDGIAPLVAAIIPEPAITEEDAAPVIVVEPRKHIVVDWLPEHDWLAPVGPERGFKDDCPVCLGWGELADHRDPANPERIDCAVCDGTGARRGTTLYTVRARIRAQAAKAAERITIEF